METKQEQPVQQNVNIETMTSEELALMLSEEHRKLFLTSQNIRVIEQLIRNRMPQKKIEGPPETPTEKTNDGARN